ncbi:hypothetical protein MF406_03115 [Georgenia sp. TF02-10]|uniref:hypothetical protein n=1 Tax=Georgenia sp. TF02-10 TaxID=2917725 RepID=UPI001FA6F7D6|nr:hypothetical protein [Georgenia sp. TF02-10]UNX55279.1 hypothetical protein MF406_03115 [Georgenia sp. TF02-10]
MPEVQWVVESGGLYGDDLDAGVLEAAVRETGVVALVRPGAADHLPLVLAVQGRGRAVGVVRDGEVVPGPTLRRFVEDLAAATGTEVAIGGHWSGGQVLVTDDGDNGEIAAVPGPTGPTGVVPAPAEVAPGPTRPTGVVPAPAEVAPGPTGPTPVPGEGGLAADPAAGPAADPAAEPAEDVRRWPAPPGAEAEELRLAAVTPLPLLDAPFRAQDLGIALAALDLGERRVLLADRRGLGVGGWSRAALPAVVLSVVDGEPRVEVDLPGAITRSWAWESGWRPVGVAATAGPGDAEAAAAFAEEVLGRLGMAAAITAAVPGAEADAVVAALDDVDGRAGLARLVAALGLPPAVADVLAGTTPVREVPGARVYEPGGIGRALGEAAALETRGYGAIPQYWDRYRSVAVDRPRAHRVAVSAEAALGAALVARRLLVARRGRASAGAALVGVGLLVDSVAELVVASWVARRTTAEGRFVPGRQRQE